MGHSHAPSSSELVPEIQGNRQEFSLYVSLFLTATVPDFG